MKLFHKLVVEIINKTTQVTTETIKPIFQEGEHVWLEAKNLQLPYGTPKLLPWCYGPFLIEKTINLVAFKLCLPTHWNIHPVFHASLLTLHHSTNMYRPAAACPPPEIIDREPKYEVESILNHKGEEQHRK
jgi:hypothetical protein